MCDLSADAQPFVPSALVPPAPAIYYNHCCFYLQADSTNTTDTKTDKSCQADFAVFTWHTAPVTPSDTITDFTAEDAHDAGISCQTAAEEDNTGYTTTATSRDNETLGTRDNETPVSDYTTLASQARDNETPVAVSLEIDTLAEETLISQATNTDYTTIATQARDNETPVSVSLEIDTFAAEFVIPRSSYMETFISQAANTEHTTIATQARDNETPVSVSLEIDTFAAETIIEDSFTDDMGTAVAEGTIFHSTTEESPSPCHHGLKRFFTENVGFLCDVCHTTQDKDAEMWGCRECNFDVCLGCPNVFTAEIDDTVEVTATDSEDKRQCDDTPSAGFAAGSSVPGSPRTSADLSADTSGSPFLNMEFLSGR